MSNDYFKAQGWFKNYATSSEDSRGVFQELVKEDEEAFRLASAETDKIKAMMNEQYGPGTIKYGSEIKQPEMKTPQAAFEFSQRNPAAEGGQMVKPNADGSRPGYSGEYGKNIRKLTQSDTFEVQVVRGGTGGGKGGQKFYKTFNFSDYGSEANALKAAKEYRESIPKIKKDTGKQSKGQPIGFKSETGKQAEIRKILNQFIEEGKTSFSNEDVRKLIDKDLFDTDKNFRASVDKIKKETAFKNLNFIEKQRDRADFFTDPSIRNKLKENYKKLKQDSLAKLVFPDEPLTTSRSRVGEILSDMADKGEIERLKVGEFSEERLSEFDPSSEAEKKAKIGKRRKKKIDILDSKDYERKLYDFKKEVQAGLGLEKIESSGRISGKSFLFDPIDMGHQSSITQLKALKQKMRPEDLNPQFYKANRVGIRKYEGGVRTLEKALDKKFYPEQKKLYKQAQKFLDAGQEIPENLQNKIITLNEDIQKFVDKTVKKYPLLKDRVNPITIDANNLTVKRGNNVFKQLGIGLIDQDIGDIKIGSMDDLTIKANLAEQTFKEAVDAGLIDEVEGRKKLDKFLNARPIDYIDSKGGTTLSSGFNTDLLMKDPLVKKLLNSKSGKAIAQSLRGTAGAVGKVFGGADIILGIVDYENNISKGQKPNEALQNAFQAMSINLYKGGDRARTEEVKKFFVKNGGDAKIFDQVTSLNTKDQEINDLIYNNKKTADRAFIDLSKTKLGLGESIDQRKTDYGILKKSLNEEIKNKIEERDGMVESYKTNLRVSEAGAPIQIGNQDFFSKPFKDTRRATMDKIESENKNAYDMQKRQVNYLSGNIGNYLQNNIFTLDPVEKAKQQKLINEMDERELYKFNLQRGMNPDNPIRIEDILRYKQTSPDLMGVNTTKYVKQADRKAEGGIIGLRSKYEYKK